MTSRREYSLLFWPPGLLLISFKPLEASTASCMNYGIFRERLHLKHLPLRINVWLTAELNYFSTMFSRSKCPDIPIQSCWRCSNHHFCPPLLASLTAERHGRNGPHLLHLTSHEVELTPFAHQFLSACACARACACVHVFRVDKRAVPHLSLVVRMLP